MTSKNSYSESSKADFESIIEKLEITDLQKHFLRSRWLDQVQWMTSKSDKAKKKYYILRLIAIVGGVIVPALVSMNLNNEVFMSSVRILTFIISLLVAISVAIEEFFHYGERWRHYRNTSERLKIEGWDFFQLSGSYKGQKHSNAYTAFATLVEDILRHEVEIYMTEIARENKKKEQPKAEDE